MLLQSAAAHHRHKFSPFTGATLDAHCCRLSCASTWGLPDSLGFCVSVPGHQVVQLLLDVLLRRLRAGEGDVPVAQLDSKRQRGRNGDRRRPPDAHLLHTRPCASAGLLVRHSSCPRLLSSNPVLDEQP